MIAWKFLRASAIGLVAVLTVSQHQGTILAQEAPPAPAAGGAQVPLPRVTVQAPQRSKQAPKSKQKAARRPPPAAPSEPPPRVETATSPVVGYVANRSASGTKTDTPLIETPQSISVISRDQMTAQGVQNLAQALRYTPGVSGEVFGLDLRCLGIQIRGFKDASDTIFYKDSLQLKGTAFSTFSCLDLYGAERLEVVRGPASVLYGQGEPSGIINYVSKRPLDTPFREIELGVGNFNHKEAKFDFTGPLNQEKTLLYRLTGLVRDSDTQVDYVGEKRGFIAPALTWKPNLDTTLTVLSHYQRDSNGWGIQFYPAAGTVLPNPNGKIPSSRFTGEPTFDKFAPTTYSIGYLFEHKADDVWTFRQNARYAGLDNQKQIGVFGCGLDTTDWRTYCRYGDIGKSKLDTFAVDNQAQAKFGTGPLAHTLLLGLDYQRYKYGDFGQSYDALPIDIFNPVYGQPVTPGAPYHDVDQLQAQAGVYLQDQIKLGRWVLLLGGRHDWAKTDTDDRLNGTTTKQSDRAFTGRAGLLYLFDNGVAPYVSYSTSFLPVLGADSASQPFKPQTGRQYEAGVKYQPPGWNAVATLAVFDLTRQNVLTVDPLDANFQVQTGEIRSRGVELEFIASLTSGWDIRAAYTILDTKITADNDGNVGNTPYGIPDHQLAIWADYTIRSGSFDGLGFGAGLRHIGSTWGGDANLFMVPAATLADAAIHYDWRSFRFAVNAKNLFDKEYVASCFNVEFGCLFGERRRVIGSVRYRW